MLKEEEEKVRFENTSTTRPCEGVRVRVRARVGVSLSASCIKGPGGDSCKVDRQPDVQME